MMSPNKTLYEFLSSESSIFFLLFRNDYLRFANACPITWPLYQFILSKLPSDKYWKTLLFKNFIRNEGYMK